MGNLLKSGLREQCFSLKALIDEEFCQFQIPPLRPHSHSVNAQSFFIIFTSYNELNRPIWNRVYHVSMCNLLRVNV